MDPPAYTEGNIPRSAPYGLLAANNADVDVSARREFIIREKVRLGFQADAFNVNNSVHFATPELGIDSATFGIFTAMANSPASCSSAPESRTDDGCHGWRRGWHTTPLIAER